MARRAAALATLLRQVNTLHPTRDTASDGWIGDASHGARPSDHNPTPPVIGVVRAQDFDADGPAGFDLDGWLWDQLLTGRDSRISYVISRGLMFSSYPARGYPAWTPRPYRGVNGHFGHVHVSVKPSGDDDGRDWRLLLPTVPAPSPDPEDDDMTPAECRAVLRDEFAEPDGPIRLVVRKDALEQSNRAARAAAVPVLARLAALEAVIRSETPDGPALVEAARQGAAQAIADAQTPEG